MKNTIISVTIEAAENHVLPGEELANFTGEYNVDRAVSFLKKCASSNSKAQAIIRDYSIGNYNAVHNGIMYFCDYYKNFWIQMIAYAGGDPKTPVISKNKFQMQVGEALLKPGQHSFADRILKTALLSNKKRNQ